MIVRLSTFSGSHGTGKTTLMNDLRERLKESSQGVIVVPSASSLYAEQLSKELGQTLTYADINSLGLREKMQYQLPVYMSSLLRHAVGAAVSTLIMQPATHKVEVVNILVDRWFSDIATYNIQEGVEDERILKEARLCLDQFHESLKTTCEFLDIECVFHHFLTTTKGAEGFKVDEDKFRANTDPVKWEAILGTIWHHYTVGSTHVISTGGRDERVGECLSVF